MTNIVIDKALLEQAIEVLTDKCGGRCNSEYNPCHALEVATTLRAALAEPAVEPVPLWDIEDLAHSALQEALSYGLGLDLFVRYFKVAQKASPQPPAEVPLLSDEEMMEMVTANAGYGGTNFDRVARAIEQAVRIKFGMEFVK